MTVLSDIETEEEQAGNFVEATSIVAAKLKRQQLLRRSPSSLGASTTRGTSRRPSAERRARGCSPREAAEQAAHCS